MSKQFPTHKQFIAEVRARLRAEYPETAHTQAFRDTVATQTDEGAWLRHLGELIEKGVHAEAPVLDTLLSEQLYTLKKIYAPRGSLDWYTPSARRTNRSLDPIRFSPKALFAWAREYAEKHRDANAGVRYPTFAQAAKHFGVSLDAIESACVEWEDNGRGYMGAVKAIRTSAGIHNIRGKSRWQVEAYV